MSHPADDNQPDAPSFAETAMSLGGKSVDEAQRIGKLDRADDQVEGLFRAEHQTSHSPIHRGVWEMAFPVDLFTADEATCSAETRQVMEKSLAIVEAHQQRKTLLDEHGKTAPQVVQELAAAGYFGLAVPKAYGGSEASFRSFAAFLTDMAKRDPTVAGLASVHGCIGAVNPVKTFGTAEQKQRWLPALARGERLSAFALTEPGAGSDLTALKTTAVRSGDQLLISGEKLFITNVELGRTIALVCLLDNKPAVVIVDLPPEESEQFQLVRYGLHALRHTVNRGLKFKNFPVPIANLLTTSQGNGLTIAYHGLNLGRVALAANAAGVMRRLLAGMIPWANYRRTYGAVIANRELVQRRIGKLAGSIVATDALAGWCATLLDRGYRGEMECIVAKVFASEALQEAAIELSLKTHGGRAFLHGHDWGDHLYDFLAPCIYEGESELLGLALFKTLVKQHGTTYFQPLAKRMHELQLRQLRPFSPGQMYVLRNEVAPYARWMFQQRLGHKTLQNMPRELPGEPRLKRHAKFAARELQRMALTIDRTLREHQLKVTDRQCRLAELSARVQKLVVVLCTALAGMQEKDELTRRAADIFCWDAHQQLTGQPPNDEFFAAITELGGDIAGGNWQALQDVPQPEILMRYDS